MVVPPASDPIWRNLVTARKTIAMEFLAAKMLLARLRLVLHESPGDLTEQRCAHELYRLYADNAGLPSARRDIEKLAAER